jgi:hypothetical protein
MKIDELNLDTAAQKMYGHPYNSLSAWGKQHVREVLAKMNKVEAPHNVSLPTGDDPVSLRLANEKLSGENEQLRQENADLWQDNADLQEQLTRLQGQWNRPAS